MAAPANFAEFAGEMSCSAYHDLGFSRVLLVEGVTEVKTAMEFLRQYGKEHQVLILPLGGAAMINSHVEHELESLKRLSARTFVLIDSEREYEHAEVAHERREFMKLCAKLGFDAHMLTRRATENYLAAAAIQKVFGEKYDALPAYGTLRKAANGWNKSDNWRIAREMTRADLAGTDLGTFFDRLCTDP